MLESLPESASAVRSFASKLGPVTVPADHLEPGATPAFDASAAKALLGTLGSDLGLTTIFGRSAQADSADFDALPASLDEATRRTLGAVDVVWTNGTDVVAVFALQDQDGNRGGVRRLADLMALHPKLKASLYVVAVAALREGLVSEIHRPVHRLLKKPLSESVRILDWNRLESEVVQLGERVRYLKPEFLEGISETAAT
ncbi:MAG TPA: hypothetical protein PK208_15355 [Fibrobacteria bacterium]|nr:hypothetical protein [Fibrobacteria bacterium]